MNTATQIGIDAVNKSRQSAVEGKASLLIQSILQNRNSIKVCEEGQKLDKEALKKLSLDVITQQQVLGTEFSAPLNANQQTIANVIAKMNDANARSIELTSQQIINRIKASDEKIASISKNISSALEELAKLAVDVVTLDQVAAQ